MVGSAANERLMLHARQQIIRSRNALLQRGVSLIEILVTLAIAGILSSLAVPSFKSTILDNRLNSQISSLMSHVNRARSEAIKRNVRVTLCKSPDGATCTKTGNWNQGWIVFVESSNENGRRDAGETILQTHGPLKGNNTMTVTGNISDYISFVGNGFSRTASGAIQTGSIALCDGRKDDSKARAIQVSATGRSQTSRVSELGLSCS